MSHSSAWTWRKAVATESGLPATTRHVLLTLSLWMNELGEGCYPSVKTLVEATGLSNRSVITHLQKAAEMGWIIVSQHGFRGQKWRSNEYRAAWPGRSELPQNDVNFEQNIDQSDEEKVVNLTTGGEPNAQKVVNLMHKGGEPNDIKVVKEVHTNSPKNNPINNTPPQVEAKTDFQIRKDLRMLFDQFGMSKPTEHNLIIQFRKLWDFGCQRPGDIAQDAFVAFGLMDAEHRAAAMDAMPFYAMAQRRQSASSQYVVGLAKWITKRSWEGMVIPETDREQFRLARDNSTVLASKEPELYRRCVELKYAGDPTKLRLWSGFSSASFPKQMVVEVRAELALELHGQTGAGPP